jgi:hypothetical protein
MSPEQMVELVKAVNRVADQLGRLRTTIITIAILGFGIFIGIGGSIISALL